MKAILVIDLNDTTLNEWDTDTSKCWAEIKVHTPIKGGTHGIGCVYANNNVELKPMPTKIYISAFNKETGEKVSLPKFDGYNACIDEILGDTEDE